MCATYTIISSLFLTLTNILLEALCNIFEVICLLYTNVNTKYSYTNIEDIPKLTCQTSPVDCIAQNNTKNSIKHNSKNVFQGSDRCLNVLP